MTDEFLFHIHLMNLHVESNVLSELHKKYNVQHECGAVSAALFTLFTRFANERTSSQLNVIKCYG